MHEWMTVRQLKAALSALPPEYEDALVSLAGGEYSAVDVEAHDRKYAETRYMVDIGGY